MNTNTLICIIGPTAIGKTSLAIKIAQNYKTQIFSADSRQFYKEMKIGTAVPDASELAAVPHHFIQHKSIVDPYSVGDFEREAMKTLEDLFTKHNTLIMVGGSGLYVKSVTEGLDYFPEVDPAIRKKLNLELEEYGITNLQQQLQKLDPDYYAEVDRENPHRIIRALEICLGTGKPYSSFINKKTADRPFTTIFIGLTAEREIIYNRINQRVALMMEAGLLEEAKKLYSKRRLNALNTVGYKELFQYFDGNCSLEQAVEDIKKNTRRFAKRQLTWFRKNDEIKWFDASTPPGEIIDFIASQIDNPL